MEVLEQRETSHMIIQHLKATGIKIKRWKGSLSEHREKSVSPRIGLFGIPLQALPLSNNDDSIPQFMVDACQFLSQHLDTEGLFRKSGSMTRIKALKVQLEAGEGCWDSAQPCDVASLLKQFLRDLPDPLIMPELQEPLCRIQQLAGEEEKGPITALITCLMPRLSARTLRYFCKFLQRVASRCDENKMDLANLAVVFAPNLFRNMEVNEKLTGMTERQLQRQAAVVQTLVTHASEIGRLPEFILEKMRPPLDASSGCRTLAVPENGGNDLHVGVGGGSRRRRHRHSMGELVNGALSKLITGRTTSITPLVDRTPSSTPSVEQKLAAATESTTTRSTSFKTKRKVSEDAIHGLELSAKKRRESLEPAEDEIAPDQAFEFIMASSKANFSAIEVFSQAPTSPAKFLEQSLGVTSLPSTPHAHPQSSSKRRRNKRLESKRVQRKHSGRNSCASPVIDRKDHVRKSLRLFQRPGKPQVPINHSTPDAKNLEPSGWILMKRMVTEAFEGPIFTGRDLRSAPKTDELPNRVSSKSMVGELRSETISSHEETELFSTARFQRTLTSEIGLKPTKAASSFMAPLVELQSPPSWRRWFTAREQGPLSQGGIHKWKTAGAAGDNQLSGIQVLQEKSIKPCTLRRSLSLPENLSEAVESELSEALRVTTLESPQGFPQLLGYTECGSSFGNTDVMDGKFVGEDASLSFPDQSTCEVEPSIDQYLQNSEPLELDNLNDLQSIQSDSGMATPACHSTPPKICEVRLLESPSPTKLENHFTHVFDQDHPSEFRMNFMQVAPNQSVRNLPLNLHSPSNEPFGMLLETKDMEGRQRTLRRQGARRYGRSLSHESALAIRAAAARCLDDVGLGTADGSLSQVEADMQLLVPASPSLQPPSPMGLVRGCNKQIFVSRKQITLTFGGRRGRKEVLEPPQTLEVPVKNASPPKPGTLLPKDVCALPQCPSPSCASSDASSSDLLNNLVPAGREDETASPHMVTCS
ncbi:rho GTPase-activating protein 11A-like [Ambystoma mexicanum]|uniref:rho GTPase-activating protein 11A-like n=1 Tax=Ambystoma mexicanum TaxID=8296 RepID=UPI0037E89401